MSYESEKSVIGCILMDSSNIAKIPNLKAGMFSERQLGILYYRAQGLYENMDPVNIVTLVTACKSEKFPEDQIMKRLKECIASVMTGVGVESFADSVISDYKCAITKKYFEESAPKIFPITIDDVLRDVNEFSENLLQNEKTEDDSAEALVKKYEHQRFCKRTKPRINTGFKTIDSYLGGMEGGDVIIIGARPSVGKSALATQIVSNVCEKGYKAGYYNLEMQTGQVYDRFMAQLSGIDMGHIRNAECYLNDEEAIFHAANEKFASYRLRIIDSKTRIDDIRMSARHMQYDLIVVDYMQLIDPGKRYAGNRASEVGEISREMKKLAMSLNVPIILLSQLNRDSEKLKIKEPSMAELRESGAIEQDASIIMLMWNASDDGKHKKIKIEKNRQGTRGVINLFFDGSRVTFEEEEWEDAETDEGSGEPNFR